MENNKLRKVTLDKAANLIGISRKTLDDYFNILRKAEGLGFDFNKYANEKMGTLRRHVKNAEDKV